MTDSTISLQLEEIDKKLVSSLLTKTQLHPRGYLNPNQLIHAKLMPGGKLAICLTFLKSRIIGYLSVTSIEKHAPLFQWTRIKEISINSINQNHGEIIIIVDISYDAAVLHSKQGLSVYDSGLPDKQYSSTAKKHQKPYVHDASHNYIEDLEFPFELLPVGEWPVSRVMGYFSVNGDDLFKDKGKYQPSRLEDIFKLHPTTYWKGKEQTRMHGYLCFKFEASNKVVLECPYYGNAVYIVWGDWKKIVQLDKRTIRTKYKNNHRIIFHSNDWVDRIKNELWS
jgi:hypothetical protein